MLGFTNRASLSIGVFGVYVMIEGLMLVGIPGVFMSLGGMPQPQDVWVHVAGMMIFFTGCAEYIAGRTDWTVFIRWTVPLRFSVVLFFGSFVWAGYAPPELLPLALPDALGATWSWWALRADARDGRAGAVAV